MSSGLLNAPASEAVDVEAEFQRLSDWWHRETAIHSNLTVRYGHPAFQQILALGSAVLPVLFREMETRPSWLIGALWELTGADPVVPDHRGHLSQMPTDWIGWGRKNGYAW